MDNHVLKGILLFILLPAIIVPAEMARVRWRDFSEFKNYYENLSIAIADIAAEDKNANNSLTATGLEQWQQQTDSRLQKLYTKASQYDSRELTQSVELTRKVFEEVARLRHEYAAITEPLASARMQDHTTVNNAESYQWRTQTLDDIKRRLSGYRSSIDRINETVRQALADNNWSKKYREYVWQEWGHIGRPRLMALAPSPESALDQIESYAAFFEFMYNNRDAYHIESDGAFVFSYPRYVEGYVSVANSMGGDWQKFRVSGQAKPGRVSLESRAARQSWLAV